MDKMDKKIILFVKEIGEVEINLTKKSIKRYTDVLKVKNVSSEGVLKKINFNYKVRGKMLYNGITSFIDDNIRVMDVEGLGYSLPEILKGILLYERFFYRFEYRNIDDLMFQVLFAINDFKNRGDLGEIWECIIENKKERPILFEEAFWMVDNLEFKTYESLEEFGKEFIEIYEDEEIEKFNGDYVKVAKQYMEDVKNDGAFLIYVWNGKVFFYCE